MKENGSQLKNLDDLLISCETKRDSDENTVKVLSFLAEKGYEVSYTRSQGSGLTVADSTFRICFHPKVKALTIDQKTAISALLSSTTRYNSKAFLGWLGTVVARL